VGGFEFFMTAFLVMAAIIIGYDIYLFKSGRPTESWEMMVISKKYPIIPFFFGLVVGVLAGHFWFEMC
jgi:hypothetical protein